MPRYATLCEYVLQLTGYEFQVGLFLFAARRSGDGDRATRAWAARRGKASSTAWGDRFGQDVHHGEGHREGEPSDAGARAQQNVGGAALPRVSRIFSGKRGRVFRQLLRLLPA